jgi:FKBP-type peptidyl-prolyl cis-trans isomerase FkpA
MKKLSYLFVLALLLLMGCTKNQSEIDDKNIRSYISANHLNAVAEPNGLYYVETKTGTGGSPTDNSRVWIKYTGYFLNGEIFDQDTSGLANFYLYNTLNGWQEGVPLMKKGGKCTLLIPSLLGYGANGYSTIPGNAVLVFDIELLNFQ